MRKLFIALFMFVSSFGTNVMADGHSIKMGIILGFTGPIESLNSCYGCICRACF
jgi:branched-chain amino acid transport system substrate-binding protein